MKNKIIFGLLFVSILINTLLITNSFEAIVIVNCDNMHPKQSYGEIKLTNYILSSMKLQLIHIFYAEDLDLKQEWSEVWIDNKKYNCNIYVGSDWSWR